MDAAREDSVVEQSVASAGDSGVFRSPLAGIGRVAVAALGGGDADGPRHGGMALSRFVAIGALLRVFPRAQKAEILAAIGLEARAWEASRAAWMAALADPAEPGVALATTWSDALDAAVDELRAATPSIAELAAARDAARRPADVPSYLRAPVAAPVAITATTRPPAKLMSTAPDLGGARPATAALPFRPAPPAPSLTLEQVVSLEIDLVTWPGHRAATLARYGVAGEAAYAALNGLWSQRRSDDAAIDRRWTEAAALYRAWLAGRGDRS